MPATEVSRPRQPTLVRSSTAQTSDRQLSSQVIELVVGEAAALPELEPADQHAQIRLTVDLESAACSAQGLFEGGLDVAGREPPHEAGDHQRLQGFGPD